MNQTQHIQIRQTEQEQCTTYRFTRRSYDFTARLPCPHVLEGDHVQLYMPTYKPPPAYAPYVQSLVCPSVTHLRQKMLFYNYDLTFLVCRNLQFAR